MLRRARAAQRRHQRGVSAGRTAVELDSSGGGYRSEIFADGRRIATYVNNTTGLDYSDWLGTERLTATVNGTEHDACTSLPYGGDFACTGPGSDPTPLHFTGQQHDNETGLDHFPARYYTSTWGVWITPDRGGRATALTTPQSWDLYAYRLGNPLTLLDPDGRAPIPPVTLWSLQHFSTYVGMRSTVLAAGYAADRPMVMTERMGEALDGALSSGGPPSELPDAANARNMGAWQHPSDLGAPAAAAVLKAEVVKWMNAKTTSVGDLKKALAALKATQAVTAKLGAAGKVLRKVGGLVQDVPGSEEISTTLKITGGLFQLGAGQDQREYGYLFRKSLIPLLDKRIEDERSQPTACMLMSSICKK